MTKALAHLNKRVVLYMNRHELSTAMFLCFENSSDSARRQRILQRLRGDKNKHYISRPLSSLNNINQVLIDLAIKHSKCTSALETISRDLTTTNQFELNLVVNY